MHKHPGKATYITVAAILASMVIIPSAITMAQAQGTPLVPNAAQSMSGMKMSGMNMGPSVSTSNLTTTRDSVTVLLEGKAEVFLSFIM